MSNNVVEHIQALGEAGVAALADTKSFLRGDAIDPVDVDALQFTGEEFYAQVMGTNPYLVQVWLELDTSGKPARDKPHFNLGKPTTAGRTLSCTGRPSPPQSWWESGQSVH